MGFVTASAHWQRDWQATLEQAGHKVGVANPALFYNAKKMLSKRSSRRRLCCGWLASSIGPDGQDFLFGKYSMRESHRLGFGNHCERHAELFNRIVSVGTDSDGRRYVRIEPDNRHAELVNSTPHTSHFLVFAL